MQTADGERTLLVDVEQSAGQVPPKSFDPQVKRWLFAGLVGVCGLTCLAAAADAFKKAPPIALDTVQELEVLSVPNHEHVVRGYNVFVANPFSGHIDPGITDYNVFSSEEAYMKAGMISRNISTCEKETSSSRSSSAGEILRSLAKEIGIQADGVYSGAFSGSSEVNRKMTVANSKDLRVVRGSARCIAYSLILNEYTPPPFSSALRTALNRLPEHYGDGQSYFNLIKNFGTHYISEMSLGSRFTRTCTVSLSEEQKFREHGTTAESEVYASVAGMVDGSLSAAEESDRSRRYEARDFMKHCKTSTVGGEPPSTGMNDWLKTSRQKAMPVKLEVRPLTDLAEFKKLKPAILDNIHKAQSRYCKDVLGRPHEICHPSLTSRGECTLSTDCPDGHICRSGSCQAGCESNAHCESYGDGKGYCINHACHTYYDNMLLRVESHNYAGVLMREQNTTGCCVDLTVSECKLYAKHSHHSHFLKWSSHYPHGCYQFQGKSIHYNFKSERYTHPQKHSAPICSMPLPLPLKKHETTEMNKMPVWLSAGPSVVMYFDKKGYVNLEFCEDGTVSGCLDRVRRGYRFARWNAHGTGKQHTAKTGLMYTGSRLGWVGMDQDLELVSHQPCRSVLMSGFKGENEWMNTIWKPDSGYEAKSVWYDTANRNNKLCYCAAASHWMITSNKAQADSRLLSKCHGWAHSHSTSILSDTWYQTSGGSASWWKISATCVY